MADEGYMAGTPILHGIPDVIITGLKFTFVAAYNTPVFYS